VREPREGVIGRADDRGGVGPAPQEHDGDEGAQHHRRSRLGFLGELPGLVLIAFVLALLLKTFLVQAFYIPSASMEPTLRIGDRVLVNKVVYRLREPRRGEVVVFSQDDSLLGEPEEGVLSRLLAELGSGLGVTPPGEKDFIKRIIGLPGDTVEMRDGVVYVNGEPLPEAPADEGGYLSSRDPTDFGPVEVPPGQYFMMGDNRPNSADSRYGLGMIPREDVIGRAFVIIWPLTNVGVLGIPDYDTAGDAAASAPLPAAA